MAKNEINIAFEILLEEVEGVVNGLNEDGARALRAGNYDRATGLIEEATRLTDFRERVRGLQREWKTSYPGRVPRRRKSRRKVTKRLPRGLRTPEEAFRLPILEALVELGGSAGITEVLDMVGPKMQGTLNKYDRQAMSSDPKQIRWRNTAQWCRHTLVREGLLERDSPRGVWEISSKGRRALQTESKGEELK
jgi:restriction system protein